MLSRRALREVVKAGLAVAFVGSRMLEVMTRARVALGGKRVHVIGYHRVVDRIDRDAPINPALCITTTSFRRQMEQLREQFEVLPLDEAVRAIRGERELERDACAVTFDDGYRDVALRAAPILDELGIPATVFVPTGYAGSERLLDHDRLYACFFRAREAGRALAHIALEPSLKSRVLEAEALARSLGCAAGGEHLIAHTRAEALAEVCRALEAYVGGGVDDEGARVLAPHELAQLASAGWEIGAHTVGHVVLTHEDLTTIRRELSVPREDLQRWTGKRCRYLAYCNGFHSPALVAEAIACGYEGAVTTYDHWNVRGGDPMRIARKCLWEGHARWPGGRYSAALSAAHLHDLFGELGMTRPVDGEVRAHQPVEEVLECAT